MITSNILHFVNFENKKLCNFATCVFMVHFQLAIMKDRHNMEKDLTLYHTMTTFIEPEEEAFSKHCWKRRKCWKPALSSPKMFSTLSKKKYII